MYYKLYTLVDITHTGQYRMEIGKELARHKEQNFNTVIQTLGLRSNVLYKSNPCMLEVGGKLIGFDTDKIIRVWRFDWSVQQDNLYQIDNDPVGALKLDFNLVPYINNLDEIVDQPISVFSTYMPGNNIVFYHKT